MFILVVTIDCEKEKINQNSNLGDIKHLTHGRNTSL